MTRVPFLELAAVNAPYRAALDAASARVLERGAFIHGPEHEAFEREFAAYCGVGEAVGVASGLDALTLVLRAWKELGKLREGDEVIVPANTYIATILAVVEAGLKPVLVEPDAHTFNLDPQRLAEALGPRTRVVLPVHLYGRLAPMPEIAAFARQHGLLLLEDAAQAHGATLEGRRAGAWGDAAAFSFYPTKNLGALGDGGAVTTSDGKMAGMVRALRNYGASQKHRHDHRGVNSRLDELQAAFLRVKLPFLDRDNEARRALAKRYRAGIRHPEVFVPEAPASVDSHVWHLFVVRVPHRDSFMAHLAAQGVQTAVHYPIPPHRQAALAELARLSLPLTETLHREVVSLPLSPAHTAEQADAVIAAVNSWRG